jgi:3-demethoxyubiquinol 3-hydroxylase
MDKLILQLDKVLRISIGVAFDARPSPGDQVAEHEMSVLERRHSAGLMRVNHVGEVCAQALYEAQGKFARDPAVRAQFAKSASEEQDHLAWTARRLEELDSRTSLLNPLWYAGSFALGAAAAVLGDRKSLGFVAETERQVEAHLAGHLEKLPPQDAKSRAIVTQMQSDEASHGREAQALGAEELPVLVRRGMAAMAKVMTNTAYYL